MTCAEIQDERQKLRAERLVLAVKWAVAREVSVSFAFTTQVLQMLQEKNLSLESSEIVAMAQRIRTRMQEQTPDKYKDFVENIEVKLLETVQ